MLSAPGTGTDPSSQALVDTLTDAAIVRLRSHLQRIHGDGPHPLAILIDPVPWPDPHGIDWMQHLQDPKQQRVGLPFTLVAHPNPNKPWLMVVPDEAAHERLVNATLRRAVEETLGLHDNEEGASPRSVSAWLTPPPGAVGTRWPNALAWASQAARHMAAQARVWLPADGQAPSASASDVPVARDVHTWRFWDPRGMAFHGTAFTRDQWAQLLGPIQHWFYLSQHTPGTCQLTESMGQGGVAAQYSEHSLSFDAAQLAQLQRIRLVYKVRHLAPQWATQDEDAPPTAPPDVTAVDALLARAQRHGLQEEVDLLRFAQCAITLHPQFDQQPEVRVLLASVRAQGHPEGAFSRGMQPLTALIRDRLLAESAASDTQANTAVPTEPGAARPPFTSSQNRDRS